MTDQPVGQGKSEIGGVDPIELGYILVKKGTSATDGFGNPLQAPFEDYLTPDEYAQQASKGFYGHTVQVLEGTPPNLTK